MLKAKKAGFHQKVRFPPAFIIQRTIFEHSRRVLFDPEKSKKFRSRTWATYDLERPRIFRKLHVFIFYVTHWHLRCAWPVDTGDQEHCEIKALNNVKYKRDLTCGSRRDKSGKKKKQKCFSSCGFVTDWKKQLSGGWTWARSAKRGNSLIFYLLSVILEV